MIQKIKICGVRNQTMLDACIAHDVDYLGINFVPSSRRCVREEFYEYLVGTCRERRSSFLKNSQLVALFMNQSLAEIEEKLSSGIFSVVQLHGDETPAFCALIKEKFPDILIWKALTLREPQGAGAAESNNNLPPVKGGSRGVLEKINFFAPYVDTFLFDGPNPGSGQTADFTELKKITTFCDDNDLSYAIAGGINPDNIQLFRDSFTGADFFDTASGVEVEGKFCDEALIELLSN